MVVLFMVIQIWKKESKKVKNIVCELQEKKQLKR